MTALEQFTSRYFTSHNIILTMPDYQLTQYKHYTKISFSAMASPCEILVRNLEPTFCRQLAQSSYQETKRIESKYSRYIKNNLMDKINNSHNISVTIDEETFKLLEYSRNLFELSDGLFDITSGILRKIWQFTKNAVPPKPSEVNQLLSKIGFNKIQYNQKEIILQKGMEIDFGGIGKEYAVDQVTHKLHAICQTKKASFLVNFGGDISAVKFCENDPSWTVGLESATKQDTTESILKISQGAVATSGNSKRFIQYQGKKYGHLLNPKTGYPVDNAPLSVTTFADNCILAGSFSSLAMLKGKEAELFLTEQAVKNYCIR